MISILSLPLVLYEPPIWLQSARPLNWPSVVKVIWYFSWSAGGMTAWNAGDSLVIAASCQFLPVRASALLPPQAARMAVAPMASAMSVSLRMDAPGFRDGGC